MRNSIERYWKAMVGLSAWGRLALVAFVLLFASRGWAQPTNDNFAGATTIYGLSGSISGTNNGATKETGEPEHAGNPGGASVWYAWTAPQSGYVTFNNSGSSFETLLAVYTGVSVSDLACVERSASTNNGSSSVTFVAAAQTTYFIAVDGLNSGFGPARGTNVLNWFYANSGQFQFATDQNESPGIIIASDYESTTPLSASLYPGPAGIYLTVTRTGPARGKVMVDVTIGNDNYTNMLQTNIFGTNIYMTNIAGAVTTFTNIVVTNYVVSNSIETLVSGTYTYYPVITGITQSNYMDSTPLNLKFNTNYMGYGYTNEFTGVGCAASQVTNLMPAGSTLATATNILITNVFCLPVFTTNQIVPSGSVIPQTFTLQFNDYQNSAHAIVSGIGPIGGPGQATGGPTLNWTLKARLSNPRRDPSESTDVPVPVINTAPEPLQAGNKPNTTFSQIYVNVLNEAIDPNYPFSSSNTVVNIERALEWVQKPPYSHSTVAVVALRVFVGTARIAGTVAWTADGWNPTATPPPTNHTFALTAGSDYAIPDLDFGLVNGTAAVPAQSVVIAGPIAIPIINTNDLVTFNDDVQVSLSNPQPTDTPTGPGISIGYVSKANLTLLSENLPAGAVDTSYNVDGSFATSPPDNLAPGANGSVFALAVQAIDNKSVIGGNFTAYNTTPRNYLARVNLNGQLDATFMASPNSGPDNVVNAIAVDASSEIIIGGSFTSFNAASRRGIARLQADGALDTTFNPGAGIDIGDGTQPTILALAIQPVDGKIVAVGNFTSVNGTNCNYVARFNTDGSLDTTFNPGIGPNGPVDAVAVLSDGRIVIGGQFTSVDNKPEGYLACLNSDGSLAGNFNIGTGANNTVFAIAQQPVDGRIVVAGAFTVFNQSSRNSITRLNTDGSIDLTFNPGSGADDAIYALTLQPDGNILAGGIFTLYNQTRRVGIMRVFPDGTLDTSFMDSAYNQFAGIPNPYYSTDVNPKNYISAIGFQSDSNVVVGGTFVQVGGDANRNNMHPRYNEARLVGGATPGPGNILLSSPTYGVDDFGQHLYVTLVRTNGNLGHAGVTVTPVPPPPGPGAAVEGTNFAFADQVYALPNWPTEWSGNGSVLDGYNLFFPFPGYAPIEPSAIGWQILDDRTGPNNNFASSSADLYLGVLDNNALDGNHTLNLALSNPTDQGNFLLGGEVIPLGVALGGYNTAQVTIVNSHQPAGTFGFSASVYTITEAIGSTTNAMITVNRTNGNSGQVTLQYTTSDGTATTSGEDYLGTNGTLTFHSGVNSQSFAVPILNNGTSHADRFLNLSLFDITTTNGGALGISNATLTIINNNFTYGHIHFALTNNPLLTVTNFTVSETAGTAVITLARDGGAVGTESVTVSTSDGSAKNGANYTAVTNTITWNNNDTSAKTVTIPILHDGVVTTNLSFNLQLSNPKLNGVANTSVLGQTNATVTINNTDLYGNMSFSTAGYFVNEDASNATITVIRTDGGSGSVTVSYSTSDLTAHAGVNYTTASGSLTFGPGVFAQSFTVPILGYQGVPGPNELVALTLSSPTPNAGALGGGLISPSVATLTIINDEVFNEPSGSPDTSYNPDVLFNNTVYALALQSDGRLLAGGDFAVANGIGRNRIARLNTDGTFDNVFFSSTAGADNTVRSVVSQTDGRILVGGLFDQLDGVNLNFIGRLNLDGTLDTTFNPGSGPDNPVYVMAEDFLTTDTNRRVIVGGAFSSINGTPLNNVARLLDTGAVDPAFNPPPLNGIVYAVAVYKTNDVANAGKVLIGGDFIVPTGSGTNTYAHIARLNPDGTLDTTFNPLPGTSDSVRAIAIQVDDKVLVGGLFTSVNGVTLNHVARMNNDGSVDGSFNPGAGPNDIVDCIALQEDLKILLGGEFTQANGVTRNRLTRLNSDGSVDPSINFGYGANNFVASVVVQTNGEIVIGGGFTQYDGQPSPYLARLYGLTTPGYGSFEFTQAEPVVLESATNAVLTVERLGGTGDYTTGTNITVVVTTSDDTAIAGVDYITVSNVLNFPVGETFATVTIPIINNMQLGPDKDLFVNLSNPNPPPAALGNQPFAVLTIVNVNGDVSFSAPTYTVNKNVPGGNALINIVRSGSASGTVSVDFSTTDAGTAQPGQDYTPVLQTVIFGDGVTNQVVSVPINNNGIVEGNTTVGLALGNPTNTFVSAPSTALLTIIDNNHASGNLKFSLASYSVLETGGSAAITVVRTNGSTGQISVQYAANTGTAAPGVDYIPTNNTLVFADGETEKTFLVPVLDDTNLIGNVTVNLTLFNPAGGAAGLTDPSSATLTIVGVNNGISMGSAGYFVNENTNNVQVQVVRVAGTNGPVTVQYTTVDGTARSNVNYTAVSGTLTFQPTETLKSFTIPIIYDPQVTGNLAFQLQLLNPTNAQLVPPSSSTISIIDVDTGVNLQGASFSVLKNPAGTNATITVLRSGSTTSAITIDYAATNGTAIANTDYTPVAGPLTFGVGQTVASFTIPILPNNLIEGNQTVNVALFNPVGSGAQLLAPSSGVLTIVDINSEINFSSPSYSVNENGVNAQITISRNGTVTNGPASVTFTTTDGTAHSPGQYTPVSTTVNFAVGDTSETVNVPIVDDGLIGGSETVLLSLSGVTGASTFLGPPATATLTIFNNDGAFIIPAGTSLTHESITPTNGVIDPNETVTVQFGLRDVSGGNTTNLVATLLATNGVTAPGGAQNYGALVQNGPTVSRPYTFTANGTNGSIIAATFLLQDGAKNLGSAIFNFVLGTTTNTYSSPGVIVINQDSGAAPYPSTNLVTGASGVINKVDLTLLNLSHQNMSDVNVLLVAPSGQKELIMGDVGGNNAISNVTLTFDDAASVSLPSGPFLSGTYKPTQLGPTALFPSPAPSGPYGTNLSGFNGLNANGSWLLYVFDNEFDATGVINGGWSLQFLTANPVLPNANLVVAMTGNPNPVTVGSNITFTVAVTNSGPSPSTGVTLTNVLPAGLTYVSASSSQGSTSVNGSIVACSVGNLATNGWAAFTVVATATSVGTVTNTVTAAANEFDPNPADNTASVVESVVISEADLALGLSDVPSPLYLGTNLTYIFAITNNGAATATGTMLTNTLPPGVIFVSATTSQGSYNTNQGVFTLNLGNLGSGATATATLVVQPKAAGTITNLAGVFSSVLGPFKTNNFASVKTVVLGVPLGLAQSGGNLTFSWPSQSGNYVLQSTTNLIPPVIWTTVTNPVVVVGQNNTVTVSVSQVGKMFFRLDEALH